MHFNRFFDPTPGTLHPGQFPLPSEQKSVPAEKVHPARSGPILESGIARMARRYRTQVDYFLYRKDSIDQYDPLILEHAELHGLDPRLVKSVIAAESEFNPEARSWAGALGLMQVMPRTAETLGVDRKHLYDPESNIKAGAAYLAYLFSVLHKRHGLTGRYSMSPPWVVRRVIASYHAGLRYLRPRPLLRSTQFYLAKILMYRTAEFSRIRKPLKPAQTRPPFPLSLLAPLPESAPSFRTGL